MYRHDTGEEVWNTDHETYGKTRDSNAKQNHPVTGLPFEPNLRSQGQYEDVETGLYQNRYRYYDPNVGRYISQDPIGLSGGLNAYQYCPNPVGYVDPLGLSSKECDVPNSRGPAPGSFNSHVQQLSEAGQQNVRALQGWARSKRWIPAGGSGPQVWGVARADGTFSWRLKLKPEAGTRPGLQQGSQQPRFDARLDDRGTYVNPFTGETGGRNVGTHLPLEQIRF